jgi:hypothetical protein
MYLATDGNTLPKTLFFQMIENFLAKCLRKEFTSHNYHKQTWITHARDSIEPIILTHETKSLLSLHTHIYDFIQVL